MSKKTDQGQTKAAVREAKQQGMSPSAAGATTGASKQIEHHTHKERQKESTPRGGKS